MTPGLTPVDPRVDPRVLRLRGSTRDSPRQLCATQASRAYACATPRHSGRPRGAREAPFWASYFGFSGTAASLQCQNLRYCTHPRPPLRLPAVTLSPAGPLRVPCASPVASAPWESSYSSPENVKFDNSHHILFDTPRLAVRIRQKHVQACMCIIVSLPPAGVRAQGSISASYAKSCQSSRRCKYWIAESTESSNSIGCEIKLKPLPSYLKS